MPKTGIFIQIISCLILGLGSSALWAQDERPVWDLETSHDTTTIIPLNHPWEFYWQQLSGPDDKLGEPDFIAVPPRFRWTDMRDREGNHPLPGIGYGTYRLRFKGLPPRKEGYEIKVHHEVSTHLTLLYREDDPRQVYQLGNGVVGPSAATSEPQELPRTLHFDSPSRDTVWVVLVQVANFDHARGGMWRAPLIGPAPALSQLTQREFDTLLIAVGVQLVMGIYNFVIFLRRRQEFSSLLLAICCLLSMLRSLCNGFLISYFFPDVFGWPFHLHYCLDYMTMVSLSCLYLGFIHSSFPGHTERWEQRLVPIWFAINSSFAVMALVTEPVFFTSLKNLFLLISFGNLLAAFVVLLRAIEKKVPGARLAMFAFVLMFATGCYDLLCSFALVPDPFLTPYGLTIFIFLQSQVVAGRFADALDTAEHLSLQLQQEIGGQSQKLQRQREKLEQQHGELLRSHRELQDVHDEKDGFFRHISHEIRTPLTLILGTISNTRRTGNFQQGLGVIEKNSLRLLRLVNQLLDLQRYQGVKNPQQSLTLAFSDVLLSCTEYVQQTCQELHLQFIWMDELESRDEQILGQVDILEKILLNFLANAMKYTPAGGEIRVRLQRRDNWLRCVVEDTGPGIREENLSQLFQLFSRLNDADQKVREGTGIGLALCRELAASMQGRVGVDSRLGQGSQFWMEFPRLRRAAEYSDLLCLVGNEADAAQLPPLIERHSQLHNSHFTRDRSEFVQWIHEQKSRVVLVAKGPELDDSLNWLKDLHGKDPNLVICLLIDQNERVEYVHEATQTGAVAQVFYRPLQARDVEILESYRIRELLVDKPILDLLFLDDHADIRAMFTRAIAEHTLIDRQISCRTVEEGRNILRQHRVKVVVADLNLDGVSGGLDLLQFAFHTQPDAFRVLLSAESSAYKIQEITRSLPVHKLLFKPFDAARDMAILQSFVDSSPLQLDKAPEDLGSGNRAALYMNDALFAVRESETVKKPAPVPARASLQTNQVRAQPPRILLIDDVFDMRQMIAEILVDAGMEVVECQDAREALQRMHADQEVFDLVISDWMMPRMTGLELLQALRSHPLSRRIPCILLTAKLKHEVEASLALDGITRYVPKPFDHLHFAEVVQKMLPSSQARIDPWQDLRVPGSQKILTLVQLRWLGMIDLDPGMRRRILEKRCQEALAHASALPAFHYKESLQGLELVYGLGDAGAPEIQIKQACLWVAHIQQSFASADFVMTLVQGPLSLLEPEGLLIGTAVEEAFGLQAYVEPGQVLCNQTAAAFLPQAQALPIQGHLAAFVIGPRGAEAA